MGADGHITLWRYDDALAAFPDLDKLLVLLPNTYVDKLDGTRYIHAYHGDNCWSDWREFKDIVCGMDIYPPVDRQREFWNWLHANSVDQWEVWT